MIQGKAEHGPIDEVQSPHHRVCLLSVKLAPQQECAEYWHERDRDYRRAHHGERRERHQRRQAIGQKVAKDDAQMRRAVGFRGQAIFLGLLPIHLRAHVEGDADPLKDRHDQHQHPEGRRKQRRQDDDHIQERNGDQDFNDALTDQIESSAEIALQTADDGPDHQTDESEKKREENRNTEAIEQARRNIAAAGIRTKVVIAMPDIRRGWGHGAQARE